MYNDNFKKPEYDKVIGGVKLRKLETESAVLQRRRNELGLSQQMVADCAGISLRQYQRFELGERYLRSASMRIGLAICDILALDPHRFVGYVEGQEPMTHDYVLKVMKDVHNTMPVEDYKKAIAAHFQDPKLGLRKAIGSLGGALKSGVIKIENGIVERIK